MDEIMNHINTAVKQLPTNTKELITFVNDVRMAPVFICIHYTLVALSMRRRDGSADYARSHPFASLFVCVTSCFGGTAIMNFLLGRPIIAIYLNTTNVMLASVIWYLILFAPFDIFLEFTNIRLIKVVLLSLKEIHRMRMIVDGINICSKLHPGNMLVIVLMGSVRGSGAKFLLRPLDSFIRGSFLEDNEFLKPSFSTKHAVLSSLLIYLVRTNVIDFEERQLICLLVVFAAIIQLLLLLTDTHDPYEYLEALFCKMFFDFPSDVLKKELKKKTD